jgi:hypothetical protein
MGDPVEQELATQALADGQHRAVSPRSAAAFSRTTVVTTFAGRTLFPGFDFLLFCHPLNLA